ncbi:MAG: potassium channel family protein [Thermodesulfobacteriota bacterium]
MRKSITAAILLALLLLFGSFGYMVIEKSSFADGLYMTLITITTVGYGEVVHLSPQGRWFTMLLILVGVGFVMLVFSKITEAVVEGRIQAVYGRLNMKKKVSELTGHYIICGFGRIGQVIAKLMKEAGKAFVVIENDPAIISRIGELGYLFLEGQASNDDMLLKAGVQKASGLIAVVSSDADNVYIVLSARGLNPDLYIMARSSGIDGVETKLLRAGANKVLSPYYIGATRMAHHLLRPTVTDFIDLTVHGGELGLRLEELQVASTCPMVGKSLLDSNIRRDFDLIVVAIKRRGGDMQFNPNLSTEILGGDTLVVLGEYDRIKQLEKIMAG